MNTNKLCEKVEYHDQAAAKSAAGGMSKRGKGSMSAYICSACGKWHLTTTKQRMKPPKKEKYKFKWRP